MEIRSDLKVEDFTNKIQLKNGAVSIELKSYEKNLVLYSWHSKDNMPENLHNIIDTPQQLYDLIKNLNNRNFKITKDYELLFSVYVVNRPRNYILPLSKTEMSN